MTPAEIPDKPKETLVWFLTLRQERTETSPLMRS